MAEAPYESGITKGLAHASASAVGALITGFTAGSLGPAIGALAALFGAVGGLSCSLAYRRYVGILGAGGSRRGSREREAYNALRASLIEGNKAARLYAHWLTRFLDWAERFFGDAGKPHQTLFPRAFGLKNPAPLWTAPAFDRCLLIALIYPIATIFTFWAVSGHVGPAEAALQLPSDLGFWRRAISALCVGTSVSAVLHIARNLRERREPTFAVPLAAAGVVAFAGAFAGTGAGTVAFAGAGAVVFAVVFAFAGDFAGTGTVAVTVAGVFAVVVAGSGAGDLISASAVAFAGAGAGAGAGSLVGAAASLLQHRAVRPAWQGIFLSLFLAMMVAVSLAGTNLLAPLRSWRDAGPLLLFLGLLTLLNAPFDWFSLGLTRALLRRGLELSGWYPLAFALIDAVLAAALVAALTVVMVVFVQAFDALAVHSGGVAILPLDQLFSGIAARPAAPEYWWAYALLLSTMIPSLLNLMIGGASLMRGVPGLPSLLLRSIPDGKAVLPWDRHWIAAVLTGQITIGAILGIAAQAAITVGVILYVMPWLGFGLLDLAREVAAFNLSARLGRFF